MVVGVSFGGKAAALDRVGKDDGRPGGSTWLYERAEAQGEETTARNERSGIKECTLWNTCPLPCATINRRILKAAGRHSTGQLLVEGFGRL